MRKILFAIIVVILMILTIRTIVSGTNIIGTNFKGVTQISEYNQEIDNDNKKLNDLITISYPSAVKEVESAEIILDKIKSDYDDQVLLLSNSKYYKQTEKYKVEFLWTRIGNYARVNSVTLDLRFKNSVASGLYDIDITTSGEYSNVAQFIYDIENDSKLGFKIENFSMQGSGGSVAEDGKTSTGGAQANFSCKEIRIDLKSVDGASSTTTNTTNTTIENTNTETNTTNTNTTTNTTSANTRNTSTTATQNTTE